MKFSFKSIALSFNVCTIASWSCWCCWCYWCDVSAMIIYRIGVNNCDVVTGVLFLWMWSELVIRIVGWTFFALWHRLVKWIMVWIVDWFPWGIMTFWEQVVAVEFWLSFRCCIFIIWSHNIPFPPWNVFFIASWCVLNCWYLEIFWLYPDDICVFIVVIMIVWFEFMVLIMMWLKTIVAMKWIVVIVSRVVGSSVINWLLANVFNHLIAYVLWKDFALW